MSPPFDFDIILRQYRDARTGRVITREQVRGEIDKLVEFVKREAKSLSESLNGGKITLVDWEIAMRDLLKSGHIIAASVGRGGRIRMDVADWGTVGAKIKWQYGYLRKLARKIATGRVSKPLTVSRAQLYASALHITFYKSWFADQQEAGTDRPQRVRRILNAKESCKGCTEYAAMGFIPVDAMPMLGELECGDFCRCDLEFENE